MAIGAALAIGALALTAVGQIAQGQAAQNQANFQAQVVAQQGQRAEEVAAANAISFRKKISRKAARSRVDILAGGGKLSGSSLLNLEDFIAEAKVDELRIRQGGVIQNIRAQQQSSLLVAGGKSAARLGLIRGGASLLTGFGGGGIKFGSPSVTEAAQVASQSFIPAGVPFR